MLMRIRKRQRPHVQDPTLAGMLDAEITRAIERAREHLNENPRSSGGVRRWLKELEPISKSFEEDNEAGKLDKAKEIVGVVFPANEDPALPLNPGEEALDEPASHTAA